MANVRIFNWAVRDKMSWMFDEVNLKLSQHKNIRSLKIVLITLNKYNLRKL